MKAHRGVSFVICMLTIIFVIACLAALARVVGVYFFVILFLVLLILYRKEILAEKGDGHPLPGEPPVGGKRGRFRAGR